MIARRLSSSEPQGQVHKCNRSEWRINVGSHKVHWKYSFVQLFNADQWSFRHRRCSAILFRQFGWKRGEISNIDMNCDPFVTHSRTERVFGMFLSVEMGHLSVRLVTLETSTGEYSPPVDFCSISARRWIKCSLRMKHRHEIFLWLNLGISHPTAILSQSVAGGAMSPAPYFSVLMCWEKRCEQQQLSSAPLAPLLSTVEVRVGGAAAFLVGGRGLYNRQG